MAFPVLSVIPPMMIYMLVIMLVFAPVMVFGRINAAQTGAVPGWYFKTLNPVNAKTGKVIKVPNHIVQFSRQYANMFEMPVLFYAVCCLAVATKTDSELLGVVAWVYVAARLVHMVIHVTSNSVIPRLSAFVASSVALVVLLIVVGLRVLDTYELPSTEGTSWTW